MSAVGNIGRIKLMVAVMPGNIGKPAAESIVRSASSLALDEKNIKKIKRENAHLVIFSPPVLADRMARMAEGSDFVSIGTYNILPTNTLFGQMDPLDTVISSGCRYFLVGDCALEKADSRSVLNATERIISAGLSVIYMWSNLFRGNQNRDLPRDWHRQVILVCDQGSRLDWINPLNQEDHPDTPFVYYDAPDMVRNNRAMQINCSNIRQLMLHDRLSGVMFKLPEEDATTFLESMIRTGYELGQ
ncbi:hypothetical protein A2276_00270 [candidate division WOR-1 bacterium RIFOXYA12_FULL_43_27]|uniref:Uncharacterized protein n=1 Tax=candidate division WOR-1 bacterium RIFOXYC2_FULL_46_14 TaxID=1802587 RepID=A0A1F4U4R5_UNCSA|nr:MAG: hypothetical protein A2276_00270 [candidate division WOR-1 bacterium RIFOXYA12_FULL_43_27]OGC20868.1 MAG: hypothetical protein A2292_07605 [candidate division WOR-1 bacterium RIFOXYB2_FULL_46_45]OGC31394.1 MAG: hypothetical protein A2232_03840 [candidate division WOR-1 bacterium RIFOXYA2_FULL_46_56]OGC39800.1 MAG: hypothetical protein A2438_04675 [candidate division WOR-1 bacterium RIFOXYC2_FULL_46_14]